MYKYINAVKALYRESQAVVKVGKQTSEVFSQTKGVKQGSCVEENAASQKN